MTKPELLALLKLLSALESAILCAGKPLQHYVPDYLLDQITEAAEELERESLK